ncbi:MAG TPA: class I SAM-dependent methyltransferase [Rhizomicrobium sp.]|nr:class I SAM-dependent methyltransferase [Rhizomicrobium sp.]
MAQIAGDHAALMDSVYRNQRYIYDFTRKYYLFGRDRLIAELAARSGDSVVEIGCGTARNLIRMARLYPETSFYGLDASEQMLVTARRAVNHAGMDRRIHLTQGFAENLSPSLFGRTTPFDTAVFSYSLSMIPDWKQSLKTASAALTQDGKIHIVDFGDLTGLGSAGAGLLKAWLKLFHVSPRVEILRRLENKAPETVARDGHLAIFPARYAFLWRGGREAVRHLML